MMKPGFVGDLESLRRVCEGAFEDARAEERALR